MDYSIQCLLVMQYFREKMQVFSGGGVEYGLNAEALHEVYAEWRYVLDEKRVNQLRCALYHLFECKILRKSIMDFDDYQALDTSKSLDETSRLYMSPRGIELMNMLERDSILLEMLRECVWREYSGHEDEYCLECSHDLVRSGRQNNLFMDLLEYVESLHQMEVEFLSSQEGISLHEYRKLFGSSLVVERLLSGIENSLRFSGKIYNSDIAKKFYQVTEKIVESKMILMEG